MAGAILAIVSDTPKLEKSIDTMNCKKRGCALYIEKYFEDSSFPANVAALSTIHCFITIETNIPQIAKP